jgi:hypothetical protein
MVSQRKPLQKIVDSQNAVFRVSSSCVMQVIFLVETENQLAMDTSHHIGDSSKGLSLFLPTLEFL